MVSTLFSCIICYVFGFLVPVMSYDVTSKRGKYVLFPGGTERPRFLSETTKTS